jgi:hypothetical protein
MNHKRRRPKNRRAGCLLCKPHKGNGQDRRTIAEKRQDQEKLLWPISNLCPTFSGYRIGPDER